MTRVMLFHQPVDGGVGRHVADLATGLSARGHDVVLCGPAAPSSLGSGHAHVQLSMGRAVSANDLRSVARFARIVRHVRPDVIHAHSSKAGAIARLARPLHPSIPVIYTPHGYAFDGHFSRPLERLAYREIERLLAPIATRVVCVCEAEAKLARAIGPARRVRVVYNGIEPTDDRRPDPRIAALAEHGPVVCALTQLRPGKGLETLIDAMTSVLARHPQAQLAIGGEGPELQRLQARTARMGIADRIHFFGMSCDPLAMLRGADIFVHPSWAEAFPYVVLEAMWARSAIVASNVGGIGEALIDGQSGILVAPGERGPLADALSDLLEDPLRRAHMGEAAGERVRRCFTLAKTVNGVLTVYGDVIA